MNIVRVLLSAMIFSQMSAFVFAQPLGTVKSFNEKLAQAYLPGIHQEIQLKNYVAAKKYIQIVLKFQPNNSDALYYQAQIQSQNHQWSEARQSIAESFTHSQWSNGSLVNQARSLYIQLLFRSHMYKRLIQFYQQLPPFLKQKPQFIYLCGMSYYGLHEDSQTRQLFRQFQDFLLNQPQYWSVYLFIPHGIDDLVEQIQSQPLTLKKYIDLLCQYLVEQPAKKNIRVLQALLKKYPLNVYVDSLAIIEHQDPVDEYVHKVISAQFRDLKWLYWILIHIEDPNNRSDFLLYLAQLSGKLHWATHTDGFIDDVVLVHQGKIQKWYHNNIPAYKKWIFQWDAQQNLTSIAFSFKGIQIQLIYQRYPLLKKVNMLAQNRSRIYQVKSHVYFSWVSFYKPQAIPPIFLPLFIQKKNKFNEDLIFQESQFIFDFEGQKLQKMTQVADKQPLVEYFTHFPINSLNSFQIYQQGHLVYRLISSKDNGFWDIMQTFNDQGKIVAVAVDFSHDGKANYYWEKKGKDQQEYWDFNHDGLADMHLLIHKNSIVSEVYPPNIVINMPNIQQYYFHKILPSAPIYQRP